MKLYMHPASTTARPVMLFIADHGLAVEQQAIDILAGEQYQPAFVAVDPKSRVPVLEDGDFRLTESSAILKYLADKIGSPTYPKELRARARVNEALDWCNTDLYHGFGYGLCYAQLLDHYKLPDEAARKLAVAAGKRDADRFLRVFDDHVLGPRRPYLCGEAITIADYLAAGIVSVGEVIGCTFEAYPNLVRWYERMKSRPNWRQANAGLYAWVEFARGPAYVTV